MIATMSVIEKINNNPLVRFYEMQSIAQWILVAIIGMLLTFVVHKIAKDKLNYMWTNLIIVVALELIIDIIAIKTHAVYLTPMIIVQEILAVIFTAHTSQGMYDWVKRITKKKEMVQ